MGKSVAILSPTDASVKATGHRAELSDYIIRHVKPRTSDGRAWTVCTMSVALQEQPIDLLVRLWLKPPAGAPTRTFTLTMTSHSVLASVRSDWNNSVSSNRPELVGTVVI
jgi:hypothetical protein